MIILLTLLLDVITAYFYFIGLRMTDNWKRNLCIALILFAISTLIKRVY